MRKNVRMSIENEAAKILKLKKSCYNRLLHQKTRYDLYKEFIIALNNRYLSISIIKSRYDIDLYRFTHNCNNYSLEEIRKIISNYSCFLYDTSRNNMNVISRVNKEFNLLNINKHSFREVIGGTIPKEYTFRFDYFKNNKEKLDFIFNNRRNEIYYYQSMRDDIKSYLVLSGIFTRNNVDSSDTLIDSIFSDMNIVISYLKKANKFKKYKKYIRDRMLDNSVIMNFDMTNKQYYYYPNKNVNLKINLALPFDEIVEKIHELYINYDNNNLLINEFFKKSIQNQDSLFKFGSKLKILRDTSSKLEQAKIVFVTKLLVFDCFLFGVSNNFVEEHLYFEFGDKINNEDSMEVVTKKSTHFKEMKDYIMNRRFIL